MALNLGAKPPTGFSFGNIPAPAPATGFGQSFSTPSIQQAPAHSTAFGQTNAFGAAPFQSQSFGQTNTFGINSTQSSSFGNTSALVPYPVGNVQNSSNLSPASNLENAIMKIVMSYPGKINDGQLNPNCRFKWFFYNNVDPQHKHQYLPPANVETSEWEEAEANNPNPVSCVPFPIYGFESLRERFKSQQEYASHLHEDMKKLERTSKAIQQACFKSNAKLEYVRRKHSAQTERFLKLLGSLELLLGSGMPFGIEEMDLLKQLEIIQRSLDIPRNLIEEIKSADMQMMLMNVELPKMEGEAKDKLDPIVKALLSQKEGIDHLSKILDKDARDLNIIHQNI